MKSYLKKKGVTYGEHFALEKTGKMIQFWGCKRGFNSLVSMLDVTHLQYILLQ
jgi:hypothetical protein